MGGPTPQGGHRGKQGSVASFRSGRVRPAHDRLLAAMLTASGELGYDRASVRLVIERAGASRATFYRHFADKEDCFTQAYRDLSEWVYARLAGAAKRQRTRREGLRAAVAEALQMCASQPAFAKALIVEPLAAGGAVRDLHERHLGRLSDGLDLAREDLPAGVAPPPSTAAFTVGALETLLRAKLIAGDAERVPEMLPSLLYMAVMPYFGGEVAWEEMAAAPVASWSSRRRTASELPRR